MEGSTLKTTRIDPNGLYRIKSIVRTKGGPPPLIDVSPATWWKGVAEGLFPQPVRAGRMTFWRGEDLLECAARIGREGA